MRSFLHCQPTDRTKKNTDFTQSKNKIARLICNFKMRQAINIDMTNFQQKNLIFILCKEKYFSDCFVPVFKTEY